MNASKLHNLGLALLLGLGVGRIIGNLFFGFAIGAILMAGSSLLLWGRRYRRDLEQKQAHQLVVFRALAEQAVREGVVTSCTGCHRPMQVSSRRCLYCGAFKGDPPLR